MRSTAVMARWLFAFGFTGALLTAIGCSSGSDSTSAQPVLACANGVTTGSNAVVMSCVAAENSTTEQISVVMNGPAAGAPATTLNGLNFDVTYDPTKLEFVPDTFYPSALFPDAALRAVELFNGQQGRVVVGIHQVVGDPNVSVAAGSTVAVLSLSFRSKAGATFASAPLTFENTEATSPSSAVTFTTTGPALSYQ